MKEVDAKKNKIECPKPFKLAVKAGKDTIDLDPNAPKEEAKVATKAAPTAKPTPKPTAKPAQPVKPVTKPVAEKPQATKPAPSKESSNDLSSCDPNDPIEIAMRARHLNKSDVLTELEAKKYKI